VQGTSSLEGVARLQQVGGEYCAELGIGGDGVPAAGC
jgi:hypothetical protein